MKSALTRFNPVALIRAIFDARAEAKTQALLQQEDALMAQRLKQHRLANRQRMCRTSMGTNAISHPGYVFNKRHSNDDAVYSHFRAQYLEMVKDMGELARGDNPAHCRHAARLAQQ